MGKHQFHDLLTSDNSFSRHMTFQLLFIEYKVYYLYSSFCMVLILII